MGGVNHGLGCWHSSTGAWTGQASGESFREPLLLLASVFCASRQLAPALNSVCPPGPACHIAPTPRWPLQWLVSRPLHQAKPHTVFIRQLSPLLKCPIRLQGGQGSPRASLLGSSQATLSIVWIALPHTTTEAPFPGQRRFPFLSTSTPHQKGPRNSFWLLYPIPSVSWLPSTSSPLITGHRLMCKESIFVYHKCILKQVKKRKIECSFTLLNGL